MARGRDQNPSASGIVIWGLEGADHWLKKPECRALFSEFRDLNGRPLTEKLDELQMEAAAYLRAGEVQGRVDDTAVRAGADADVHLARQPGRVRLRRPAAPANPGAIPS